MLEVAAGGEALVLLADKAVWWPAQRTLLCMLAGHLHPCVTLRGRAHDRLRLPCFHFDAEVRALPAFGSFTGMHAVRRQPGDRVFAAADGQVILLPAAQVA